MVHYVCFVCVVFLNMIVSSYTWAQKNTRSNYTQGDEFIRHSNFEKRAAKSEDEIIRFPGDGSTSRRHDFSAEGKGLDCIGNVCEDASDYPYDHINSIMSKISTFHNLFGHIDGTYVDQTSRIDPDVPQSENLCASSTYVKFPKTLPTQKNITKYIVNVGKYKQGVIFETCLKKTHCRVASFPVGYTAQCVQKYSTLRLLSVEAKDGEPAFDSFVVPSCCVCLVTQTKSKL